MLVAIKMEIILSLMFEIGNGSDDGLDNAGMCNEQRRLWKYWYWTWNFTCEQIGSTCIVSFTCWHANPFSHSSNQKKERAQDGISFFISKSMIETYQSTGSSTFRVLLIMDDCSSWYNNHHYNQNLLNRDKLFLMPNSGVQIVWRRVWQNIWDQSSFWMVWSVLGLVMNSL